MARDYILREWRPSGRPSPPSVRPTWPPPRLKQGPYWVEHIGKGVLRCTPRRGTYAYKRMIQEREKKRQADQVGWVLIGVIFLLVGIALVSHCL
jgi:hypothetical protein